MTSIVSEGTLLVSYVAENGKVKTTLTPSLEAQLKFEPVDAVTAK
jgi:hypothetical protein